MLNWKINLIVLTFGQFVVLAGMTMILPFIPYYLQELGITDKDTVAVWQGVIFASNFVTAFLFQPLWGKIADKYGRKLMIWRSSFGMAIVITLMGFATSAWHLLFLRLLNGMISGYMPASTSIVSATTPKERIGFAMGILQSGAVAGTILGPLIGGVLQEWIGFKNVFYITGSLLLFVSFFSVIFVRDNFNPKEAKKMSDISLVKGLKKLIKIPQLRSLYALTFFIQLSMISTVLLMPLFVQEMHGNIERLVLLAGLVGSVTGFSNMIFSPILGRLGDKVGKRRILFVSMIGAALLMIPHAFVNNIQQLLIIRFIFGIFLGGLMPSVNALIRQHTPNGMESRAFSLNASFMSLGNVIGPIAGGTLSIFIGIRGVFLMSAIILSFNCIFLYRNFLHSKTVKSHS
ncbi:MFS transporter [Longirhabdus pacifica]|uniref:MFS transporter n=1 Tax=Longirhabdus pacifica TaxID=2305227 RepID=UPI0010091440|nr:MFS transporter [Longirhabdus pacifica]